MITIKALTKEDSGQVFEDLSILFKKMYENMNSQGLNIKLSHEGEKEWCASIQKTLGKLNCIYAAFDTDEMIGFGAATLRLAPPYLNNYKIGAVTHIYVSPEKRATGVGKMILIELEKWMKSKEIHSAEIEVLNKNITGIKFWKENGFEEELLKMRKFY